MTKTRCTATSKWATRLPLLWPRCLWTCLWALRISSWQTAKKLPKSLGPTLAYHREKKGLSQEAFAELLGCDPRSIRRLEKEEGNTPSREFLGLIGVSLKLPGVYTEDLMNKAGKPLLWNVKEDMELKFVIYYMNQRPLDEINLVLTSHHCRPLRKARERPLSELS